MGRETRSLSFPQEEIILVHPLNQYKAVVVTTRQVATLNTRSLSLSEPLSVRNISRASSPEGPLLVSAHKAPNFLLLLLSTG